VRSPARFALPADWTPAAGDGIVVHGGRLCVRVGLPTVTGAAVWDVARWDDGATWAGLAGWVDVTCDVRAVTVDRGRAPYAEGFDAGVARVVLANLDGRYSPWNRASPFATNGRPAFLPGVPVQVWWGASVDPWDAPDPWDDADPWDGVVEWHGLFAGVVESIADEWPDVVDAETTVTLVDPFRDLAAVTLHDGAGLDGQTTGQALATLCDLAGFRWPTLLDDGTTTIGRPDVADLQAVDVARLIALSDGGDLYCAGDGTLRFADANALPRASGVVFADTRDGGAVPYLAPGPGIVADDEGLANVVRIVNTAGAVSTARDDDSVARHGERHADLVGLFYASSSHGDALAARLVAARAHAVVRVVAVDLDAAAVGAGLWSATVGTLDLTDTVRVRRSFAGDVLDVELSVVALAHVITPTVWTCRVGTAPYLTRSPLPPDVVDGWDRGRWDLATWEAV
jgi:hypothetical protein